MGVQLTEEQRVAVENRGGSLLVSAAAGSGKTKVLVERLFRYILQDHADVTDFLIITYTKAAAAELRMKIAAELSERLAAAEDSAEVRHLQRQTLLVYRADVRTVDSFCTNLLRENVHLLGQEEEEYALTPDFRVLDEHEADLLRLEALERVLEDFYETIELRYDAALLADTIGAGRDDRALQELILQIYGKLQSHAYPERWLQWQEEYWSDIPEEIEKTPYGRELMDDSRAVLQYWIGVFDRICAEMECDDDLREKYLPAFQTARESMNDFRERMEEGWDAAHEGAFEFQRLKAVRGENELKERAKALWDQCKKECEKIKKRFSVTNAEMQTDLRHMAPAMLALLRLVRAFSAAYAREKLRRNATDFSDQEHFALRLLCAEDGTPTEVGRAVSARYREIMIDEFQDTNEVQNQIFAAVSKKEQNLFMVGDMKQSIYRFRLADPGIFLHHYQNARNYALAAEGEERKLLLSKNFRSRREILETANFLCKALMSSEIGEMDYTEDEALHFGAEYYCEKEGCETEFYLVDYQKNSENEAGEDVKCAEAEARFVAHRIRKLLDEPYMVQGEDGALRSVREEDIVILMRSPGPRQKLYERVLAEQGIACAAEESGDFFASMEISVLYAVLQIIDNPHQDIPLLSVLRSPIFAFSADRLATIRANCPTGDFYAALQQDDGADSRRFLADLEELRFLAPDLSVHRLLWHLYNRWNVLGVFGAMDNGAQRRSHLVALYEHARKFESSGYKGLFSFVSHLRALLEAGETIQTTSGGSAGVRLMSIHKSKGLEFPVVILTDLNKGFNKQDLQSPVLMHPEMGLGPVCVDLARRIKYSTVAKEAVAHRQMREQKSEEMRVLYVALTRPKEKLIMVSAVRGAAGLVKKLLPRTSYPVLPEVVVSCDSMAQWILLPLLCRTEAYCLRHAADMAIGDVCNDGAAWKVELVDGGDYQKRQRRQTREAEKTEKGRDFDENLLSFRYPYVLEEEMPSKVTATQIKGRLIDQRVAEDTAAAPAYRFDFPAPRFAREERGLTAAERGIAMHQCMQFLDFSKTASQDMIRAQVEQMVEKKLLTAQQGAAVNCGRIAALFATELGQMLSAVPKDKMWREYRFSVLEKLRKYVPEAASEDEILLQGAVDCFFEDEDGLTVVDFKTDRVRPGEEAARAEEYRVQLLTYCEVLSRIFEKPVHRKLLYFFTTGAIFEF